MSSMHTSTPQSGERQKPLSPVGAYLSPATRSQPVSAAGTPTLQNFTSNDDEWERKQRRRSRVIDLQLSNADSPASTISPSQRSEAISLLLPKLSNAQISDHYSTCIKLSQENRITTKNAFGLHLIDYMGDILKEKDSELTNFKVAAGTLDASAKIYAVRVDAVHADVYKVLGGLGKESQGPERGENQDVEDAGKEPDSRRRKRQHSVETIEQNLNNITRSATERSNQVDPLFQKAAASFDECSTVGVFLSTLRCSDYHSELHFDNYVIPLSTIEEEKPPAPGCVDITELKPLVENCVEKHPLCPSLAKFRLMQLGGDVRDETVFSLTEKYKESDHAFDVNAEVEDDGPEPAGQEMDDFDADVCDENEDLGEFSEQREACRAERKGSQITQIGEADIGTMCLQLSSCPGEYSYFSPRTMSMWAGPEHWRFRPRQKVESVGDKQKSKKVKKVFELNFEEDIHFEAHFCKTRAATTLAKATLENQNKKSTTLPADFHYDPDNIVKMSLRPADRIKKMAPKDPVSEDGIGEYDYNNPNDTSNFCPALQLADSDDDDGGFMGAADDYTQFPIHNGLPENSLSLDGEHNLIAEPQKVNRIEINYAKIAKKMDMKHLKTSMWGLLTDNTEQTPRNEAETAVVKDERVFSSITRELQKRLPTTMAQNLSVPLAFACLLHLANEKNLKLQEVEDLSDVLIMQED
ncbi:condensin complex subunit 2 isoform X2 [Pseudophryne corroboree]|uniref:condensin complex subunit 2 isoform X2 n=1 Tax=Pseudophryne corroboree TaxID=495146 RepID=UPI00308150CC